MDAFEAVVTKLDVREFSSKPVPNDVKRKVLEAARSSGSGMNSQHWRFVMVEEPHAMANLAKDSVTGRWIGSASFAVLVLTNPKLGVHAFDAGRAVQDMGLAAWNYGVASGIYTGFNRDSMTRDFGLPSDLNLTVVIGFGYPARPLKGRKNRKPLSELAFSEAYGKKLNL